MRKRTKHAVIGVATVAGILALAGIALAWHINPPSGSASCDEESGTYQVSFIVTNWSASHPADITATSSAGGVFSATGVATSVTFSESVPGTMTSDTLTAHATWPDSEETSTQSVTVQMAGTCAKPTPSPTPTPTPTPPPAPVPTPVPSDPPVTG